MHPFAGCKVPGLRRFIGVPSLGSRLGRKISESIDFPRKDYRNERSCFELLLLLLVVVVRISDFAEAIQPSDSL